MHTPQLSSRFMAHARRAASALLLGALAAGASACSDDAADSSTTTSADTAAVTDTASGDDTTSADDLGSVEDTSGAGDDAVAEDTAVTEDDTHEGAPHWGYEGELGPEHWGSLSDEWATCATGQEQSPVDITAVSPSTQPTMTFDYAPSPLTLLNNGHTVQANYAPGSTLTVDGHTWELLQFHYHAHSEHTRDGKTSPAELHFVHKDSEGQLAVVGVFVELSGDGAANPALAPFVDHLPATESEAAPVEGVTVDAAALIPQSHANWRYHGSLTTPPCSEGVRWYVLAEPIGASAAQIQHLEAVHAGNFRPVQPLNARAIPAPHYTYDGDEGPEHWAELSPDFAACAEGQSQSPIDIPKATVAASEPSTFELAYAQSGLNIENNGHTVQVNWNPGSTLTLDSGVYELKQFHFHSHSEHLIDGKSAPIEIHFVHKSAAGALAVVGVMVQPGAENAALAPFLANLPASPDAPDATPAVPVFLVDAAPLIPADHSAWRYSGSLTTPPCSEGVSWTVMATPITASQAQLDALQQVLHANARPVQPLNDRPIN